MEVSTSLPAKNLTLDEGKTRAQAGRAASQKRADEGDAATKKRAVPGSPTLEPSITIGYRSLFDSESEEAEEEEAIAEPHEISNGFDEQQECYQAAHLQGATEVSTPAPPTPKFTSLKKKSEDRGRLFPVWGTLGYNPRTRRPRLNQKTCSGDVQELKELREDRLLSYVLDQRDLRIEFAHLVAKQQLHSVMEGLRQQSKASAHDERGSQQPSGSQPGAGLPAPTSSVTRGNLATSQAAGTSQSADALGRPAPHGSGTLRSDQGGQERPSHALEYEALSQPLLSGPSTSGRDSVGSPLSDEVRQLRNHVNVIEIAQWLGRGGQAAAQAGKSGP
ncbi:Hypothetical protein PHPALM_922 [Phytophthora palmivora]|uniref:ATP-binding cassette (ABC) Superfamily n=1 Tax=Phytophthora palmivora TaxID=4796 RepID=A0A2P4YTN7_9STRA|nr:Hypothetical protein PHPALM_922 [Phytophthora palmivora]